MKTCTKCKFSLPHDSFCKDKSNKDGLTSWCKICRNNHNKEWRENNRDKINELNIKNAQKRKEYYSDPDVKLKNRKAFIKKKFGIEYSEYEKLSEEQNNLCAICNNTENSSRNKYLAVDHDHLTGKIRGLLCTNCNRGIGLLKDSIPVLQKAIEYLNKERN